MLYKNTSDEQRTWPSLQRPDGATLELAPGEEVDLDLPAGFEDLHLKPSLATVEEQRPAKGKKTDPSDGATNNEEPQP
jgi:hypothetical protein